MSFPSARQADILSSISHLAVKFDEVQLAQLTGDARDTSCNWQQDLNLNDTFDRRTFFFFFPVTRN